jgi:uncharacterized protein (TIGR03435 family)
LFTFLSGAAFAQSPGAAPKFEAADVHQSPHTSLPAVRGPFFGDTRYEVRYASMVDLIRIAYGIDPDRIVGGPNWLELDRFDVIAITPAHSTPESRKLMLQALLADRFGLVIHNDSKPMAAYALTAGKTPKLQETDGTGESHCDFKMESAPPPPSPGPAQDRPQQVIQVPVLSYTCHNTTMSAFAAALPSMPGAGPYFDNKPVVDQTTLEGAYDFALRYTPKIPAGMATSGENMPVFEGLDKQLGLKLEASTIPMPVIAVDRANEPTANPPDVTKIFPPVPTEFDAAEIKPSAPAAPGRGANVPVIKNGRVIIPGITLENLIVVAWDINQNELIGAPKWLDSDRFDVIAKAPDGVALGDLTPTNTRSIPVNIDALRPMLRALLIQRFKLAVHTEDRPKSVYTLVAVKPKLQKADPAGRTKWTEGPAADGKDPRNSNPVLGRLVTCHNMTMAQFAHLLQEIAPGYIHDDVVDATGLEGNWDFTFNFSGAGQLQGGGRSGDGPPAGPGGADAAPDPTGALSLLDALPRQLGLKLEMQKQPKPVLVIDHVEQKPSEN